MSIQALREQLASRERKTAAKAELGKLGINFNYEFDSSERSAMLAQRADARRAINAVQATIDDKSRRH